MLAMIYGGSGSGKSEFAERLLLDRTGTGGDLLYVATMYPEGGEARERIARHRENRAHKGFTTIERYTDLEGMAMPGGAHVLLECLGNLVANECFAPGGSGAAAGRAVLRGVESLLSRAADVIVVTNDVFSDGEAYAPETERYRSVLSELNRRLAGKSSLVVETVCGIPLLLKNEGVWSL